MSCASMQHAALERRPETPGRWVAARRLLCLLLATVALLGFGTAARAAEPELTTFELSRDDEGLHLAYAVDFELSRAVEDALNKAVPLFFVAEAEVFRDRWYWRDRRVAHTVRTWRIVYQPLTSTYRVTYGGLSQNYPTRAEAIAAISRSSRWKIADPAQLEEGGHHYVEFSYRLDTSLMPRPMQIGVSGQADWTLAVKRTQRFN
jgi:hypothetical protein